MQTGLTASSKPTAQDPMDTRKGHNKVPARPQLLLLLFAARQVTHCGVDLCHSSDLNWPAGYGAPGYQQGYQQGPYQQGAGCLGSARLSPPLTRVISRGSLSSNLMLSLGTHRWHGWWTHGRRRWHVRGRQWDGRRQDGCASLLSCSELRGC